MLSYIHNTYNIYNSMSMPIGFKHSKETIEKMRQAKLGHKVSAKTRKKISKSRSGLNVPQSGKDNPNWKGDNAGYNAVHSWLNRNFKDPRKCEHCGSTKNLHWSNKTHKNYTRNRKDWLKLCNSCHLKYDIRHNNRKVLMQNPNNNEHQRQCGKCKKIFPLTTNYFCRSKHHTYSFSYTCKKCKYKYYS